MPLIAVLLSPLQRLIPLFRRCYRCCFPLFFGDWARQKARLVQQLAAQPHRIRAKTPVR